MRFKVAYAADTPALISVMDPLKECMAITSTVNAIRSATGNSPVEQRKLTCKKFDAKKMIAYLMLSALAVPAGVTGGEHGGV